MTDHRRLQDNIVSKLSWYATNIKLNTAVDYYDGNKDAEFFFCLPLSLLFDADVRNVNAEKRNFPGIDLVDRNKRICFQITSTNTKEKVQHTLDEFLNNGLDRDFDRLVILIVNTDPLPSLGNLKCQRPFGFDVKQDVWNMQRLIRHFDSLPYEAYDKLQTLSAYLDQQLPGAVPMVKRLRLPPISVLEKSGFVGRDDERKEIRKRLESGDKLIVLSGLGGMGKTELAVRFGQDYTGGTVYFIRFDTSFTRTVASMSAGIRPALTKEEASRPEEALCAEVMAILEAWGKEDVLIIDNVDADQGSLGDLMKDATFKALRKLHCRLILTTRFDNDRAIKVRPMDDAFLREIFEKHGVFLEESQMKALIDAVGGHTLTVDLMARTLNGKGWRKVNAEMLLEAIRNNTLPTEKYRTIATDYNQSPEQAQIYQHLSVVFDVAGIPEAERAVLCCATLLPADGMDGELFGSSLSEDGQDALDSLIDHGWLSAENDLVTIHPVIRLVCRAELKPSDENCGDFLEALWEQYDQKEYDRGKFTQMAEVFCTASDFLADKEANWSHHAGWMLNLIGQTQLALTYQLRSIARCEEYNHPDIATAYNNAANMYNTLGDYARASEYLERSVRSRNQGSSWDLAVYHHNQSDLLRKQGHRLEALAHATEALRLWEKMSEPDQLTIAKACDNVGCVYIALNDYKEALTFQLKAKNIFESILPENSYDLGILYDNLSSTYHALSDFHAALECQMRARSIFESILPHDHADLATVYDNIAATYRALRKYNWALDFHTKALEIFELPKNYNPAQISTAYFNIGMTRLEAKDYQKALSNLEKALSILEKHGLTTHHAYASIRSYIKLCKAKLSRSKWMSQIR